jgi:glyoxylase-like metal-dependent hydrolase (beta-lactamase superfamily II)
LSDDSSTGGRPGWENQAVSGPDLIDLHHQTDRVVGCYLLETDDGLALHDCGPTTCLPVLKAALAERGLALTDVRHLLLSHIHLDHAGAAGTIVREHPNLRVHVSEIGEPHVVDPARLETSARRLYGEAFDILWGELAPVPQENVEVVGDDVLGLECFPSPGHASHHVCYLHSDGTLYAGDAAGVRIQPGRHVMPVCPPPDCDVEAWFQTFAEIERRRPERLALIHFGVAESPSEHLALARAGLATWSERGRDGLDQEAWVAAARRDLEDRVGEVEADHWERAAPLWQSYLGMKRYWDKKAEAAA